MGIFLKGNVCGRTIKHGIIFLIVRLKHRGTMKIRFLFGVFLFALVGIAIFFEIKTPPEKTFYVSPAFSSSQDAQKTFAKQKPIILWDLHDCLFSKPRFALWRTGIWNIQNKPKFFYQFLKAALNSKVRSGIISQQDKQSYIPQAYFEALHGYEHLYTELNKLVNAIYSPNKEMFQLVKELHDEGYKQYIFSNIGPITLTELQHDYPQHFAHFSHLQNVINKVTPAPDQWIQKPNKKAYEKALISVDMNKHPHNIIFVDDREHNIKQAHKTGMNGIVFVKIDQFKKDLNKLIKV